MKDRWYKYPDVKPNEEKQYTVYCELRTVCTFKPTGIFFYDTLYWDNKSFDNETHIKIMYWRELPPLPKDL